MEQQCTITGSISPEQSREIDRLIEEGVFPNRSAAVRSILASYLDGSEVSSLRAEIDSLRAELEGARTRGDRVLVLLDVQNVGLEARRRNVHLDFGSLLELAVGDRFRVDAVAFDGRHVNENRDTTRAFHDALMHRGWSLDLRDIFDDCHQKEVDVALATRLMSGAVDDTYDIAVIVSGDRDFVPAVEYVRRLGKRVEVVSYGCALSAQLRRVADSVTLLDDSFVIRLTGEQEASA